MVLLRLLNIMIESSWMSSNSCCIDNNYCQLVLFKEARVALISYS
jgi:hypothetical protein